MNVELGLQVRTVEIDWQAWLVGKDVAKRWGIQIHKKQ